VGQIKTLTAGAVNGSTVATNTLGTVKVTGYAQPESPTLSFVFGDMTNGIITAAGGGAGVSGIAAMSVARNVQANGLLKAPFGIKNLTVGGTFVSSQIVADNPATPAAGVLPVVSVGELNGSTVRAGSIGALTVTGKAGPGLIGSVIGSTIAVTST